MLTILGSLSGRVFALTHEDAHSIVMSGQMASGVWMTEPYDMTSLPFTVSSLFLVLKLKHIKLSISLVAFLKLSSQPCHFQFSLLQYRLPTLDTPELILPEVLIPSTLLPQQLLM